MARGHPSYAATCLVCLLLTLFVPVWAQVIKYGFISFNSPEMHSTVLSAFSGLAVFYIAGLLLAIILRIDINTRALVNALTYALTPLNLALWLVYGFNYAHSGRLSVVTYVMTGAGNIHDVFFGQLVFAAAITLVWVLVVAYYCIKNGTENDDRFADTTPAATAFALILGPCALVSIAFAAFIGDVIRPGYLSTIIALFSRGH